MVPPLTFRAVAPILSMASPSCDTEVLLLLLARAIWSVMAAASSMVKPKADCASVTMSEACARSMPPAAARFRTVGSICMEVSAS